MTIRDGRDAKQAYRVRVGGAWYWVDPTVPADRIEAGDTVILYPVRGDAVLAILQGALPGEPVAFTSLEGVPFEVPAADISALHLTAPDEDA